MVGENQGSSLSSPKTTKSMCERYTLTQEGVVLQKTHVYYKHTDVKVGNWATIGKKGNTYYWDVVFGVDPDPDLNWFCK